MHRTIEGRESAHRISARSYRYLVLVMFTGRKDGTEETRVIGDMRLEALACKNLNFTDEGNTFPHNSFHG